MASVARVFLRRSNNLNHRIFHRQLPSTVVGTPRHLSTYYFRRIAADDHDVDSSSPPFVFLVDKYGPSAFTSAPGAILMKQPTSDDDDSSDDEGEADSKGQPKPKPGQGPSVKQDDEALYLKMDMPGVAKEDAKVYLEGNTLMAKGTRKSDPQFDDDHNTSCAKTYSVGVGLASMNKYKIAGIKAEMKDGVLKVKVPKLKDEERDDVLHVHID